MRLFDDTHKHITLMCCFLLIIGPSYRILKMDSAFILGHSSVRFWDQPTI